MGCLGHAFAIFVTVQRGFEIRPFVEPPTAYDALRAALRQGKGSPHAFSAAEFFAEFNRHIPAHTSPQHAPSHHDVARICRDVEEADKTHFCGWRNNTVRGEQVTAANLFKTRRMFGQRVHDFAKRRNQSTRWTDDASRAQAFVMPE